MIAPRTLVVDVGNTTVFAGIFSGERCVKRFRLTAADACQARTWARRATGPFQRATLCSVVPALTPVITRAVQRTLALAPQILTATAPHGLEISYRRPTELGTDRLACALGARALLPRRHVIVVDCGTATTITALHRNGTILGGAILPGIGLWPAMLAARTAQLPAVSIRPPRRAVGRTTEAALRSGIHHGHTGAIREVIAHVQAEAFGRAAVVVVGTGGHAPRFVDSGLFSTLQPDLILTGLNAFAAQFFPHA